ncbi:Orf y [Tanacetum coccineum]
MSLANQKATTEYQEAIQATEDLESPAVGFAKTSDYKGGLTNQVNAVIKQNNTLLYLATKQSQKLVELEEKFDKLKQEIHTIKEREVQPADLEDSISSLAKRLDSFSISGKLPTQKDSLKYQEKDEQILFQLKYSIQTIEVQQDTEYMNITPEQRNISVGENQINLRLCNEESYESLRNSGLQHIHLGIFMIRLHALHRRSAGTNALVVLRDTRWEDSRQIIATMEVDLSAGTQLVYTFPDMILSVNDFHNHVEVAIQTHGYDTWQGGESNLLITMALTGRLSNTSYMGFQYSVENVVDHLTTTGITAIPGERRSIEELEGMSWHLKPPEQTSVRVPSRVAVNERLNRSVSLRFERYRQTPQPPRYLVNQHDRERNDNLDEDEEHFIGICLQTPQEEHISYDVLLCAKKKKKKKECLNEARILEEEPLNKVRRSNKPKQSRQKSWEKWSTLGEPSGKWDYYVRYDAPPDITLIKEVAATGWGDEFSNNEVTPGKVTILEERSD